MHKHLLLLFFTSLTGFGQNVPYITSGLLTLPNGITATTQSPGDTSTKIATDAFVTSAVAPLNAQVYAVNPYPVPAGGAEYDMTTVTGGTTLVDVSGNRNDATLGTGSNAPSLYSYGVGFEDTGTSLTNYATVSTPLTNWGVKYQLLCPPTLLPTSGISGNVNPAASFPTSWGGSIAGSTAGLLLINGFTAFGYSNAVTPTIFSAASSSIKTASNGPSGGCHVYGYSLGTSTDHITIDGQEVGYSNQSGSASLSAITNAGTYQIGSGGSSAGNAWRGVVAYDITYPTGTSHTVAQMAAVSSYIWAKVLARPTFPRYPQQPTGTGLQLLVGADSLTATYGSTTTQWSSGLTLNNAYTVTNLGIFGQFGVDFCLNASNRWLQYVVPGQTKIQIWAGTNDLYRSRTAAQTWAALTTCAQKAIAAGAQPIVATMISGAGRDTNKIALNTLIRTNWKQVGFVSLNDLAAVPGLGANGAYSNTACFNADQTHLTGPGTGTCSTIGTTALTGYGIVGALSSNVVNMLDGSSDSTPDQVTTNAAVLTAANNVYNQTITAAATASLPECLGRVTPVKIMNINYGSYVDTVSAINSETITGPSTVLANSLGIFQPVVTGGAASTTGGCYWLRTL